MEKSTLLDHPNIHDVEKKSCIQCYIKQVRLLLVCDGNCSWLQAFCCRWAVGCFPEIWPWLLGTICTDKPEQSVQTSRNNLYRQAGTICADKPEQSVQTSRNNLCRQAGTICADKPEQSVQSSRNNLCRQAGTICRDKPEQSVQTSRNNLCRQATVLLYSLSRISLRYTGCAKRSWVGPSSNLVSSLTSLNDDAKHCPQQNVYNLVMKWWPTNENMIGFSFQLQVTIFTISNTVPHTIKCCHTI
jgi:hypothetical protein